jgi:hypothetical protein
MIPGGISVGVGAAGAVRRGRVSSIVGCVCAVALGLQGSAAYAQTKGRDPAAAEALFKAARALVEKGDYAAGCPKFEASLELNPSASTMLNIAQCHEHEGKLATAWEAYQRALVLNRETQGEQRRRGLEELSNRGIAALEPRVPKLRVTVKGAPAGLAVERDGKAVPAAALGEALPVDPGTHQIRASAPGFAEETREVTLAEGKTVEVELTLRAAKAGEGGAAPKASGEAGGGGIPTWTWIPMAAGVALVGVSIGFLVDHQLASSALRENCSDVSAGTFCKPGYDYESDNARKNRDLGLTIGLAGAGVVAIGVAVVGIAVSGKSKAPAPTKEAIVVPWVDPFGGGAAVVGRF